MSQRRRLDGAAYHHQSGLWQAFAEGQTGTEGNDMSPRSNPVRDELLSVFHFRLIEALGAQRISPSELAQMVGLNQSNIVRFENG